jgi:hypothetical protein
MATPSRPPARSSAPAKQAGKPTQAPAKSAPQATKPPQQATKPTPSAQPRPGAAAERIATEAEPRQTTAIAPQQTTAVAATAEVPDYIRSSAGRGSENVEMADMVIPRIELVQALSKCLEEGSAEYIEGARAGMFYNSVTRELYGNTVLVCPAFFKKQFLAWRDRKKGGGFGGAFDSAQECHEQIATKVDKDGVSDADAWEAVETAQQIILVVNPDTYETSEAVLSCARTKMKVSRQWNSLIRVNGYDRFSRIYELFSTDEQNQNGERYKNIAIRYVDFAPMIVFKAGEALYNSIAEGTRQVKIDDTYIDAGLGSETPPETGGDQGANAEY